MLVLRSIENDKKRIQCGYERVAVRVVVRQQTQRQQRHGAVAPARVQHAEQRVSRLHRQT